MIKLLAKSFGALVAAVLAATGHTAPQTFNTALPVAKGESVVREQLFNRHFRDDPGPANRDLDVRGSVSVLGHGLSRNWAIFGVVPYLDKTLEITTTAGRVSRNTKGIGDAQLFGRYTHHQNDARGRTLRVASFFGVELPTGDNDDADSHGRLPAPLQLGSGSWDPFGGIILTYQTLDYQIDAQASFKINTKANGFDAGDQARLDASLQYRLWPRALKDSGVPGYLYGVLEGSVVYQDKNALGGTNDPNSGGTKWFLSPGLQYVTRRWIVEGILQVPIAQNLGGTALEDDYTVRVGFRVNF